MVTMGVCSVYISRLFGKETDGEQMAGKHDRLYIAFALTAVLYRSD